jgi:L-threonine kinase
MPIEQYGTVRVALTDEPAVSVTPALPHATAALQLALDRAAWRGGAAVQLGGELPHSRGMGSSTADIAGVIRAVCAAAEVSIAPEELVTLMTQVEPSDSSPLQGLWAIDHVRGGRATRIAPMPAAWYLACVDSGEPTPTLDVHRTCGVGPRIPDDTLRTTRWRDPGGVARVATESALRNQERRPHAAFDAVFRVAQQLRAPGICVAHSGSLCAVICAGLDQAVAARSALAAEGLRAEWLRAYAPGVRIRVHRPVA